MKIIQLIIICFVLVAFKSEKKASESNDLIVINQDYYKALEIAKREDKMIFIDFYTTWCSPCKKLDKLVFQNDSIRQILKKDIVLLKYDAEDDSIFHLSKKYHVSSYPTGIILNNRGNVLNRTYGFSGDDTRSLTNSVLEFSAEAILLNEKNTIVSGYSNQIDVSKYPKFYSDFINRTSKKINSEELNKYLNNHEDVFSEEYFSTLFYFGREASETVSNSMLKNKDKYIELYGKNDVNMLLFFFSRSRFSQAISNLSQTEYDEAVSFSKKALSKKWLEDILPSCEKDFLMAQNKWFEVLEINQGLKNKGKFPNGAVNHFCWSVYKKCNDNQVILRCVNWMKEVTKDEPNYAFLDTYAFLLYKSGSLVEAKRVTILAIKAGKLEGMKTKSLEGLLDKL